MLYAPRLFVSFVQNFLLNDYLLLTTSMRFPFQISLFISARCVPPFLYMHIFPFSISFLSPFQRLAGYCPLGSPRLSKGYRRSRIAWIISSFPSLLLHAPRSVLILHCSPKASIPLYVLFVCILNLEYKCCCKNDARRLCRMLPFGVCTRGWCVRRRRSRLSANDLHPTQHESRSRRTRWNGPWGRRHGYGSNVFNEYALVSLSPRRRRRHHRVPWLTFSFPISRTNLDSQSAMTWTNA